MQENALRIMAGSISSKVTIQDNNNYHLVDDTNPVHLPHVNTTCDGKSKCTMKTTTVSEQHYNKLWDQDTGKQPISASEIKTKLVSRQNLQESAGIADADFHETDEEGFRCADINDYAIEWATKNAGKTAKSNYDKYGVKMVTGPDMGPYNEGPLWIWTLMNYTVSADGKQMIVESPMMRTPTDYFIKSAAGFHYCKILSPFRVMEWIYTDSLRTNDGLKSSYSGEYAEHDSEAEELEMQLFL